MSCQTCIKNDVSTTIQEIVLLKRDGRPLHHAVVFPFHTIPHSTFHDATLFRSPYLSSFL